jgi:hypothetical protein
MKRFTVVCFLLVLTGCGTTSGVHEPDPSTSAQTPLRDVPSLKVETDCGGCEVRASVPALIVEGYTRAAAESGAKPASGEQVTVSIKEYSARDDVARHLVGIFAGKDEIKATVSFQGRQYIVADYYLNAWLGIEHLARRIGEMVFERVNQLTPGGSHQDATSTSEPRRTTRRRGRTRY